MNKRVPFSRAVHNPFCSSKPPRLQAVTTPNKVTELGFEPLDIILVGEGDEGEVLIGEHVKES